MVPLLLSLNSLLTKSCPFKLPKYNDTKTGPKNRKTKR